MVRLAAVISSVVVGIRVGMRTEDDLMNDLDFIDNMDEAELNTDELTLAAGGAERQPAGLIEAAVSDPAGALDVDVSSDPLGFWMARRVGIENTTMTGRGVNIYVLSTGVRTSHQEFGGRAVPAIDLTDGPLWVCRGAAACAQDFQGRGTHAAGVAAGASMGVAREATVHACKVRDNEDRSKSSWYLEALNWIKLYGVRPAVLVLDAKGSYQNYAAAIDEVTSSGVAVLTAAGDDNEDICNPALSVNAIVVGATDMLNHKTVDSNHGSCVDIWAPGDFIVSASPTSDTSLVRNRGTMAAAAVIAGGVALLLEGNASLVKDELRERLNSTGKVDYVRQLTDEDNNIFLWVGEGPPPEFERMPAPPAECPDFAGHTTPDIDGDCDCGWGKFCSTNGTTMNCPTSRGPGWGGQYFWYTCHNCACHQR